MPHVVTINRSMLRVLVTVVMLIIILQITPVQAAKPTLAKIVSVDHPSRALPGKPIQVTVTVEYSDRFLADVGIWDQDSGAMIQSLTLISQFTGPGTANFTFQLTAPSTQGEWHLIAVTRVWWQDAWYLDPNGGASPFAITISNNLALVALGVRGANSSIVLDNAQYRINDGGSIFLPIQLGNHSLSAPRIIQGPPGERFVLVGWSDGVNSNPRQILLTQDTRVQAVYRIEYFLSVNSDIGQTAGEGWYEKGTQAKFASTPTYNVPFWLGFLTDEYHFVRWSGDSNSTNEVASLTINGPKSVKAVWTHWETHVHLTVIADTFFLASLMLLGRVIVRYSKRRSMQFSAHSTKHAVNLILLITVLFAALIVPTVQGQPLQPKASIVKIADANWYYWSRPNSDTCVLWLGGGIPEESEGYYAYWINPFNYESFGTIHFIQDLSKYYCVVALQMGSSQAFDPTTNRTINRELISSQTTILAQIHEWLRQQGYQHTFLVGYSVGAQAAVMELAYRDPKSWTSQDGLVLITVPVAKGIIGNAYELRANLLLLYGGNLPDYEATGRQFYNNAQSEGSHGSYYFHKEFYVLEDMGHEVWTVRETGVYNSTALNLVVGFIERSKALQIQSANIQMTSENTTSAANMTVSLVLVRAPNKVAIGEAFIVEVNASGGSAIGGSSLVAYSTNSHQVVSAATVQQGSAESRTIRLVVPPISNSSQISLALIMLQKTDEKWVAISEPYPLSILVTDLMTLTLKTSVPNLTILFDNTQYVTDSSGIIQIETARGAHTISMQPLVYQNNVSRLQFAGWPDSTDGPSRQLDVNNDTTLMVLYVKQYFVSVNSAYGTPEGSGWYDENSTSTAIVFPPINQQPPLIFTGWVGDSNDHGLRTLLIVNSPKIVNATWTPYNVPLQTNLSEISWLGFSVLIFAILLALNVRRAGSAELIPERPKDTSA